MYINDIIISNFRNYNDLKLQLNNGINIIYGNNAQGKTNLLESIYVLGLTKSHRSFIDNNLIKDNNKSAFVSGNLLKDGIKTKLEIIINKTNKKIKIDNNEIKKISDYISLMNIIIFYPEDLDIIKGSPNVRRRFINLELSQLYSNYINVLNDYNKLLKMRNDYLKNILVSNNFNSDYFNILTNYLIEKAVLIYRMRNKFVEKINKIAGDVFNNLSGMEGFYIKYKTNISNTDNYSEDVLKKILKQEFDDKRDNEIRYKTTLVGPHRDDIEFYLNNFNLKIYGSQGQQRMAILSIKLAEIELFKNHTGNFPILLLDDVFSELDDNKKNNLLKYISSDIQTIITTTDLNNIDEFIKNNSKLIKISDGKIVEVKEVE